MKSTPLRLIVALFLIIGTVYAVSVIATSETLMLVMILTASTLLKFIIRETLYILLTVLKLTVIIAVIGLILSYIL
jgi:predicted transglutaminase-like protease